MSERVRTNASVASRRSETDQPVNTSGGSLFTWSEATTVKEGELDGGEDEEGEGEEAGRHRRTTSTSVAALDRSRALPLARSLVR